MAESNDPRVNKDLEEARNGTSIDNIDALTHMLDGGKDRTLQRRRLLAAVEAEGDLFQNRDDIFLDRVGQYRKALARARRLKEMQAELGLEEDEVGWQTLKLCARSAAMGLPSQCALMLQGSGAPWERSILRVATRGCRCGFPSL